MKSFSLARCTFLSAALLAAFVFSAFFHAGCSREELQPFETGTYVFEALYDEDLTIVIGVDVRPDSNYRATTMLGDDIVHWMEGTWTRSRDEIRLAIREEDGDFPGGEEPYPFQVMNITGDGNLAGGGMVFEKQ